MYTYIMRVACANEIIEILTLSWPSCAALHTHHCSTFTGSHIPSTNHHFTPSSLSWLRGTQYCGDLSTCTTTKGGPIYALQLRFHNYIYYFVGPWPLSLLTYPMINHTLLIWHAAGNLLCNEWATLTIPNIQSIIRVTRDNKGQGFSEGIPTIEEEKENSRRNEKMH